MSPATGLLEREQELARLDAFIDEVRAGSGRLVLVEGEAGIGKTTLLDAASATAKRQGFTVLSARGGQLERDFAYGLARQLFEPILRASTDAQRAELLAGAAGLAAPALGMPTPSDALPAVPDAAFASPHGLYWLTANLADSAPLLLSIDDAHWADSGTLRWIAYLARRIDGLRVGVVVALRTGEPRTATPLFDALREEPTVATLAPSALSEEATAALVLRSVGAGADEDFVRACFETSAGNPFLLTELLQTLSVEAIPPTAQGADRVRQQGPAAIARSVLLRLTRLPAGAVTLAQAAAVLNGEGGLRLVAALARLDPQRAEEAADALVAARILEPDRPLRFVHPIVRTAIYRDLPPERRATAHRRAAELLEGADAPADHVAAHLLPAEPAADAWVVARLRGAAAQALGQGVPDAAATLLRRALEEPPPRDARVSLLRELAMAETLSRAPAASDHLLEALRLTHDPLELAAIAVQLLFAGAMQGRVREAVEVTDRVIRELDDAHRDLRLRLEATLVAAALTDLDLRPIADEHLGRVDPGSLGDGPGDQALLVQVATAEAMGDGSAERASELIERALADGRLLAEEPPGAQTSVLPPNVLIMCDRLERAHEIYGTLIERAGAQGSLGGVAAASCFRCLAAQRLGRLADAEADGRVALRLSDSPAVGAIHGYSIAILADVLVERDGLADARRLFATAEAEIYRSRSYEAVWVLFARGRVCVAERDLETGLADLLECGRRQELWGMRNPSWLPWRSEAAIAALGLGDREQAVSLAGEELERARAFGAPRAIGVALRSAGLAEGGEAGIERLVEAVAVLESSPARLEHARAAISLGGALRRANQRADARDRLRFGLDLANRCGAVALERQARDELAALGVRVRRPESAGRDTLTPSERRVAQFAAEGMTNREIAQALFVTVKTVETHLGRAYGKLGIGSRGELARALER